MERLKETGGHMGTGGDRGILRRLGDIGRLGEDMGTLKETRKLYVCTVRSYGINGILLTQYTS